MKNKKIACGLALIVCFNLFANLAHPVTPTFLTNLNVHNYMFGVAFACMSLTTFLFSPFWGKLSDIIGRRKCAAIGFVIYAIAQLMFGLATDELSIIPARLLAGIGASGVTVSQLAYLTDNAEAELKPKYLVLSATIATVVSAFGYMIGGILGDIAGVMFVFVLQAIFLALSGVTTFCFMKDNAKFDSHTQIKISALLKDSNPLGVLKESKSLVTPILIDLFVIVFLVSFAATCFDQSFNYFLKKALDFPTSYNGYIKAVIGIVGLIVNMTIGMRIIRKRQEVKSHIVVTLGCTLSIFLVLITTNVSLFVTFNLIFFAFNSLCIPLQQAILAKEGESGGVLFGFYTSIKALGMVLGSLVAGFIFDIWDRMPFALAMVLFAASVFCSIILFKKVQGESQKISNN